ncbi:uncharacterized protein METZ01_LOCUS162095, partial [marine metagenome]
VRRFELPVAPASLESAVSLLDHRSHYGHTDFAATVCLPPIISEFIKLIFVSSHF